MDLNLEITADVATAQSCGAAKTMPSPHLLCEWDYSPELEKKIWSGLLSIIPMYTDNSLRI